MKATVSRLLASLSSGLQQSIVEDQRHGGLAKRSKGAGGVSKSDPIILDEEFLKVAGKIAQDSAFEASRRLAEQWRTSINVLWK